MLRIDNKLFSTVVWIATECVGKLCVVVYLAGFCTCCCMEWLFISHFNTSNIAYCLVRSRKKKKQRRCLPVFSINSAEIIRENEKKNTPIQAENVSKTMSIRIIKTNRDTIEMRSYKLSSSLMFTTLCSCILVVFGWK